MPLTLRPIRGLAPPVYAHLRDWSVHEDGSDEAIERIMEERSASQAELAWFWSITSMKFWQGRRAVKTSGHAATLRQCKEDFRSNWEALKTWPERRP